MPGNSTGYLFRFTSFGESHGVAVGGVIDGCPPGLLIDEEFIIAETKRRRPVYKGSTTRKEPDEIEFISGIKDGKSIGLPICFLVKNINQRPSDYDEQAHLFRPSHADYTYSVKYGTTQLKGEEEHREERR